MDISNQQLIEKARQAAQKAYTPYSHFPVGAVVKTESGDIFEGCNIANASSGLGICAERVAIFKAVSSGHKDIARIAVTCLKGNSEKPETLMSCGACRQVMSEFMSPEAEVIVDGVGTFQLKDLIPSPFKFEY